MKTLIKSTMVSLPLILAGTIAASASDWSVTDVQILYGSGYEFGSNGPGNTNISTLTIQHASGWKYGDNYAYFDMRKESNGNGNTDIFGEYSPRLSLGKISGSDLSFGFIKDVLISGGVDMGTNFFATKYGIGLDLAIPGFDWFRLDTHVYDISKGGSGTQKASYQITPAWSMTFDIGKAKFDFTGFIDFTGPSGGNSKFQILAQPQLRLDVGNFFEVPGSLYVGIEVQIYDNKFGVEGVNETIPQFLMVYKF